VGGGVYFAQMPAVNALNEDVTNKHKHNERRPQARGLLLMDLTMCKKSRIGENPDRTGYVATTGLAKTNPQSYLLAGDRLFTA
jgi:hypothetical protein